MQVSSFKHASGTMLNVSAMFCDVFDWYTALNVDPGVSQLSNLG